MSLAIRNTKKKGGWLPGSMRRDTDAFTTHDEVGWIGTSAGANTYVGRQDGRRALLIHEGLVRGRSLVVVGARHRVDVAVID